MNKYKILFSLCSAVLITILLTTAALPQKKTAALSDEQRDALREYFETNDKIVSFGSKPLELLNKPELNDFFSQYGNALLMVRIGNDLQAANDWDGLKKVFEKIGEEAIKKISPDFAKAFGWFGWVKSGMELVKKFVYDPGVTQIALDSYATRRWEGADPEDASVNIPWGPMRTLALEQFLKQYNKDMILEEGSKDKLLPVWERKLDQYLNAWLEDLYQQRLATEAKQTLLARAAIAKRQVPGFDQRLLEVLHKETPLASGIESATLTVSNEKPEKIRTSFATQPGAIYVIEASGVVSDWADKTDGVDAVWCYAEWRCGKQGQVWDQLRINGKGMTELAGKLIPYNPAHVYQIDLAGTGYPIEFFMIDAQGSAGDNHGSITVKITRRR